MDKLPAEITQMILNNICIKDEINLCIAYKSTFGHAEYEDFINTVDLQYKMDYMGLCYLKCTKNPRDSLNRLGILPSVQDFTKEIVTHGSKQNSKFLITYEHDSLIAHVEEVFIDIHQAHLMKIHDLTTNSHHTIGQLLPYELSNHDYKLSNVDSKYSLGLNPRTIPYEIAKEIQNYLPTMHDKINLFISLNLYSKAHNTINIVDNSMYSIDFNSHLFPNGFCYLSTVLDKEKAFLKYGMNIKTDDLLELFRTCRIVNSKLYISGCYPSSIGHISLNSGFKRLVLVNKQKTHQIELTPWSILSTNDNWTTNCTYDRLGSTGGFDLEDLLNLQPIVPGYFCPEAALYMSQGKRINEPKVNLLNECIVIESENLKITINLQNDDLGKVRHEYVASKIQKTTDKPLSTLGVQGEESVLTPDIVDPVTKRVLELGTSKTDSLTNLQNEFNKKKIKYNYLLQPIECNTFYLIVGYNAVVTNMTLNQGIVDDLCARFRIGVQLETKITELLGYDIFSGYNSEDIRIAKAIFSTINLSDIKNTEHFNITDMIEMGSTPTHDDIYHSRDIISKCLVNSIPRKSNDRSVLEGYLSKFKISECQTQKKRITNIPLILFMNSNKTQQSFMDPYNSDMPNYLKTLWNSAGMRQKETESLQKIIDDQINCRIKPETKHVWKKESIFKPELTQSDKEQLALTGVGAKPLDHLEIIQHHEKMSKQSFHPDTYTQDIIEFIKEDNLKPGFLRTPKELINLLYESKQICSRKTPQISHDIWKNMLDMKLISFFDQCTEIFTELSYNYKHWTKGDQFLTKTTKSGIKMIIHNSGTHLFVSFAFPKLGSKILDTGRLGPKIFTSNNYYFTDFSSFNEPTLEHFVKSGPYMNSILIHLMSNFEVEPGTINDTIRSHFNLLSLLFLNNKTDSEEILTSQRYLFMKLFEDATQDPYIFVDRLPEVLRSRLSVFLLDKTISLMDYYKQNRILKIPKVEGDVVFYNYLNIKSIVGGENLTINQKINEFYYGYVISKERGRGSDRNFKIVKKILQEEYKFRDSVKNIFEDMSDNFKTYSTDPQLLKVFLHIFNSILKDKIGNNFKTVILEDFLQNLTFTNFTQLATLKASSRKHENLIRIPENIDNDRSKILKTLNDLNKDESSKRPKVLEALMHTVKLYKLETKQEVRHMMQLIPWCLKKLILKGYFDSDIFPKPQHGGDREIHVLEIMARIVQYTLELISKTICKYFMSETITHPETKSHFVSNHYKTTSNTFKTSFTMSKSADASKWCQRHHVSHFAAMLASVTPKIMHGFIFKSLQLWTNKKISFPLQLSATLLANRTVKSNPIFERFRDEFFSGTGIFTSRMSNKITIKSGMMQGILHYTSSLYHTMIQEVMRIFVIETARRRFSMNVVCTIVQGSDDSGMMLGVEGKVSLKKISQCYTLFRLKEEVSQYLSVYWNVCKSSLGTIDLIEYNSEWYSRMRSIKPTFRWVSACMELSVTERFIDRIRIFNQVLTQCLEGGATTLECSVIQLNQAWLHYIMLGITTSVLGEKTCELLLKTTNPQLGFFPFDYDLSCGIPGVDCQLYNLCVHSNYLIPPLNDDKMLQYEYEGQNKSIVPKDMRSVKLKFGKFYLWAKLVERINLGTLEDAIDAVQKDPMKLFGRHTSWEEEIPSLLLKIFSPGVKESINNVSSTLRMVASSAYILNMQCLSIYKDGEIIKKSLFKALHDESIAVDSTKYNKPSVVRSCFPMHEEYEQFLNYITNLSQSNETFKQPLKRTSKDTIKIFEVIKNETDLIDLCKRKWNLGGRVTLSTRQFDSVWSQTKIKFPFIRDTIQDTAKELNMTFVELKLFLESLKSKERKIILQDTSSKHGGIESAVTRIYWPNVKIRSEIENNLNSINQLRSNIFSILTFWYSDLKTTRTIQELIQNSKCLRKNYNQLPIKARKIKTIFDWSQAKSKIDLIQQIQSQKQGRLGYFSIKQKGWGNNLKGTGEWRGQVLGIPCIIKMTDNNTDYIIIQRLQDSISLGKSLIELLSEFKCCSPTKTIDTSIMLSVNGKITATRHPNGKYIPIKIDNNLKIDIISSMEEMNWSFECRGTTIRLVLNDTSFGYNRTYTILSESFSQKDWNSLYTMNTPDLALNYWCNNIPAKISLLEAHLDDEIPSNFSEFLRFNSELDHKITRQEWDISKLRSRIMSTLISPEEALKHNTPLLTIETPLSANSMLEIHQIMSDISFGFDEDTFTSNFNWADDVIETLKLDNDISGEIPEDIKQTLINLTTDLEDVYTNPDKEDINDSNWMKMSSSNKFFSNINTLSEVQCGCRFFELYNMMKGNDSLKVKGLLGKILSIVLRRHVYEGKDTHESLADIASESSRQVDTILSERDLVDLDISNLENTIDQLQSVINTVSGTAKMEMEKTLAKYKRLRLLKMSPVQTSDIEEVDYGEFMTRIVDYTFKNHHSKFSDRTLADNLKLSLIKIEVIEKIEQLLSNGDISNHEFTLMREHVNKNVVSYYLIDSLNLTYGYNISLKLYNQTKDINDIDFHYKTE